MSLRAVLKKIVHPLYDYGPTRHLIDCAIRFTWNNRFVRKYFTKNFNSGFLAVGEQNKYCVAPDWITIDIDGADFNYDIREHQPFPFADNSIKLIYSSHMVEHLPEETCEYFFKEAYRLLDNGGLFRLEAPDAERLVEEYKKGNEAFFVSMLSKKEKQAYGKTLFCHDVLVGQLSCFIENDVHVPVKIPKVKVDEQVNKLSPVEFADWCVSLQTPQQKRSGGHIHTIYFAKLEKLLQTVGFTQIVKTTAGQSTQPLMGAKLPGIERGHRDYFSIYVEAVK